MLPSLSFKSAWFGVGRTHRSNQVSAPEYIFLISALAGEQRFASIVAKRLQSLGALTHGDRRASDSRDLNKFNVDTKFGRQALDITLKSILGEEQPIAKLDQYPKDFFKRKYFTWNIVEQRERGGGAGGGAGGGK